MPDTEEGKRNQDKEEREKHVAWEAGNGDGMRRVSLQNYQEALRTSFKKSNTKIRFTRHIHSTPLAIRRYVCTMAGEGGGGTEMGEGRSMQEKEGNYSMTLSVGRAFSAR